MHDTPLQLYRVCAEQCKQRPTVGPEQTAHEAAPLVGLSTRDGWGHSFTLQLALRCSFRETVALCADGMMLRRGALTSSRCELVNNDTFAVVHMYTDSMGSDNNDRQQTAVLAVPSVVFTHTQFHNAQLAATVYACLRCACHRC